MSGSPIIARLTAAALFAGAAAWAFHQQTGYVIAAFACGGGHLSIWAVTALALVVLGAGALASFAALRGGAGEPEAAAGGQPRRFLAMVGLMAAGLFLFAILLQAAAALILPPCMG